MGCELRFKKKKQKEEKEEEEGTRSNIFNRGIKENKELTGSSDVVIIVVVYVRGSAEQRTCGIYGQRKRFGHELANWLLAFSIVKLHCALVYSMNGFLFLV